MFFEAVAEQTKLAGIKTQKLLYRVQRAKKKALKEKLEKEQGGEVVVLKKNDMKPLVAIQKIYEQSEDYGFTKEEIKQFVKDLGLAADNLLICEILSAPV